MLGGEVFKTEIPGQEHSQLGKLKVVLHGWRVEFKSNLDVSPQKTIGTQVDQEVEV